MAKSLALILTAALAAGPASASSSPLAHVEVRLAVADLDLRTGEGARAALLRI